MTRAREAALERKFKEKDLEARKDMHKADIKEKRFATEAKLTTDAAKAAGSIAGAVAKFNHPEWYKKFVSSDVNVKLPTYTRLGVRMTPGWITNANTEDNLPGICSINYLSSLPNIGGIGYNYKDSPINIGLTRFQSELRKMNSRIGQYDPSDFGLYWYASVDLAYVLIKIGKCIQVYNTYIAENKYFAKAIITAQGFNADDFFDNIQQYKALYVKFIAIFNSNIVLPASLTFAMRRIWMANLLIKDHKGSKSQLYLFKQLHWGTLAEDEGSVTFASYSSGQTYLSVSNYLKVGMSRLVDSTGIQTMIADLRAGIPESNMIKLQVLDMNSSVEISESDVDLEQIHNLTSMPVFGSRSIAFTTIYAMSTGYLAQGKVDTSLDQVELPGPAIQYGTSTIDLTHAPTVDSLKSFYTDRAFLNFYSDSIGDDDILEATRLRHTIEHYDAYSNYLVSNTRGTELVIDMSIFYYDPTNGVLNVFDVGTVDDYASLALSMLSRFDWIPIHTGCARNATFNITGWTRYGEVDNYFPISASNLYQLHDQCALSEFFISSNEFNKGFTR